MAQTAPPQPEIPTKSPQPARARVRAGRTARGRALASGTGRAAMRGEGRVVVELECGITVYPARGEGDRWRAVWYENGERRQCESRKEEKLAAELEKVTERLSADAPHLERPGADLIAYYLSPGRLPPGRQWSRKHAHTQRRRCERFAAPVIGAVTCQDIKTAHMQRIVSSAPTAGEGKRVQGMISALVAAGIAGGYLASPRLKEVHWQAGDRPLPAPQVSVAGESPLLVDPAEIPAAADVARLGQALAAGRHGERDELMASTAAYSGLRWGELTALTAGQIDPAARVIAVRARLHARRSGQLEPGDAACRPWAASTWTGLHALSRIARTRLRGVPGNSGSGCELASGDGCHKVVEPQGSREPAVCVHGRALAPALDLADLRLSDA